MDNEQRSLTDPSSLTTAQLLREIEQTREFMLSQLKPVEARFDAMDKAVELLQAYPTEVDKATSRVQELLCLKIDSVEKLASEKFKGIELQFTERNKRAEVLNTGNAAAIEKSEAAVTKQIDGLVGILQSMTKSQEGVVGDLKDRMTIVESRTTNVGDIDDLRNRVTTIESRTSGVQMQRQDTKEGWGIVFGAVGLFVSIILAGIIVANALSKDAPAPMRELERVQADTIDELRRELRDLKSVVP
jgi:hypothetical protein